MAYLTLDQFNQVCGALPHSTKTIQWMGSHVWKIGGKVYAIGTPGSKAEHQAGNTPCAFTIKTDEHTEPFLREIAGVVSAPHLKRGHWLRLEAACELDEDGLRQLIAQSHGIIATKLTKKLRADLGF